MSQPPLHVGLLTGDLSHRHGWAHYSLSLIEALREAGIEVTIVTAQNSADIPGLTLHKLLPNLVPKERFLLLKQRLALPRVRNLLRDCALIHATVEPYAPLAAWVAGNRPLLVTGHGSYVRPAMLARPPVSRVYEQALRHSHLICVSRYTAQVAAEVLPGTRITVINNGVNAERYLALTPAPSPSGRGEKANRNEGGSSTILAVGAVKARKGILELVQAMPAVRREIPNAECVIIGRLDDAAYVTRVQAEIERLALADCVRLLGHVDEQTLLDWYAAANVFVLPSMNDGWKFEGYGLVHLEASAVGLPVIGTRDCGAEDAIDDGITGLLVSQTHITDELPAAIIRLLRDPALAAQMGAAGRAKARAQTWTHVAQQMLTLYQAALTSGRGNS